MNLRKKLLSGIITLAAVIVCLFVLPTEAQAASESDLTFKLNSDGESYSVSDCNTSASGKLVIPATYNGKPVTSIDEFAFHNCTDLTNLTIPDSVTSVGRYAFDGCSSLQYNVRAQCNYLGNATNPYLILIKSNDYEGSQCEIPTTTKFIYENAFKSRTSLTSITIPNSVTNIGDYAFLGCFGLTSITIPDSVTNIGMYAFSRCTSLASVTVGNGVTRIGEGAFDECTSLTAVHVTDIAAWCQIDFGGAEANPLSYAENLFLDGVHAKKIMLPESVTSIGNYAFDGYAGLTSITVPDSVTSIGDHAFQDCTGLTSISIPDNVTSIGSWAFNNCDDLTSITIPDSVTSIGDGVFQDCTGLTNITIPDNVTSIGGWAFNNCDGLTSITIPDSVTSIGYLAFAYCDGLVSVTLNSNAISIDSSAFSSGNNARKLTITPGSTTVSSTIRYVRASEIVVPKSITTVDKSAFSGASHIFFLGDAPIINESSFASTTANVYTLTPWADDLLANYGGTLTWHNGAEIIQYSIQEDFPKFYKLSEKLKLPTITIVAHFSDMTFEAPCETAASIGPYDNSTPGKKTATIYLNENVLSFDYIVIDSNAIEIKAKNYVFYNDSSKIITHISCFGEALTETIDYAIQYKNYTATGNKAEIIITGLGAFEGWSSSVNCIVLKEDICNATITIDDCTFNGKPQTPPPTVLWNNTALTNGTDYITNYINNVDGGTATVQIIGIGNYSGIAEGTFKINKPYSKEISLNSSTSSVTLYGQSLTINLVDSCFSGYYLYKNDVLVNSSSAGFTSYLTVYSSDFSSGIGTYTLEMYTQGYTYIVQGGQYKPVASGSKSWRTYTVYVEDGYTITTPTWITALEPQIIDFRTLYLAVSANSNANLFPQTWGTSNSAVATVENGIVTLHKAGNATITVTVGGLQAKWDINTAGLNINKKSKLHYDVASDTVTIIYDNELLTEGTNYTFTTQTSDGIVTVSVQGCNLFSDTILRRFDANTGELLSVLGDIDGNEEVTQDDAVYLLLHTMFGEAFYPLDGADGDIDCNGSVTQDDAVYLLLHTMFGETFYPLNTPALPAKTKE